MLEQIEPQAAGVNIAMEVVIDGFVNDK